MFFKIGVLKNFANLTGKYLCWSLFLNKVAGLQACEIGEMFKNAFFKEHRPWLRFCKKGTIGTKWVSIQFKKMAHYTKAYLRPCETSMIELLLGTTDLRVVTYGSV